MSVRVENNGPVTTVIIDHPERRNAVDRPTATALAEAFRAFEADTDSAVAVLSSLRWVSSASSVASVQIGSPSVRQKQLSDQRGSCSPGR